MDWALAKQEIRKTVLSSKKVIIIAYYYLPDNTSGVQRAVRMAKYLPLYGLDPIVIASSHAGVKPALASVEYVPLPGNHASRHKEVLARVAQRIAPYNERLEWVPHAIHAAKMVMARERVAAVVSTSPPLATHMAALAMKTRYRVKWVADFRDPLYGNPGRPRRWARPYDMALERAIFTAADSVVGVTDTVVNEWMARYPRMQQKFHVIWNGFDPEDMLTAECLPPRDNREIAHVGVLYSLRHPYRLVGAFDRLIQSGRLDPKSTRLRFIGPIQERERFESNAACAALLRQGCMEIQGELIPRAEANRLIATADCLLLIDIVNLSRAGYTVPAKLYDYILIGRPILALTDRHSPVERILVQSGVPQVCLYHDDSDAELDAKLLRFLGLSSAPVKPSSWFLENFDGRQQAEALALLIMNK
jgi:glycosyltransferase involved in cell wall biosynthesis